MTSFYDEVEIEDFEYDQSQEIYFFPCPCGDKFQISKQDLIDGEEIAHCPSCSLIIKVIYNQSDFENTETEELDLNELTPILV
jgi:diphthamide biosynthesis protein 3